MEKKIYTTPKIEVLEVAIEQGFAQTGGGYFDVPNGGDNGNPIW